MTIGSRTGTNVRGARARSRILAAAVDCLAEGGIDAMRIARVAREADVSTGTVHYHFATREALLSEAFARSFQVAGDARSTTKYGGGSALERLRRKIEESLPYPGRRHREWELWVELWLRAVREPALRPIAASVYARLHDSLLALIHQGAEAGEFEVASAEETTERVLAAIDGFGLRALVEDPAVPVERARDQVWSVLSADLSPRS